MVSTKLQPKVAIIPPKGNAVTVLAKGNKAALQPIPYPPAEEQKEFYSQKNTETQAGKK